MFSPGSPVPVINGVVSLEELSSIVGVLVSISSVAVSVFPPSSVTVISIASSSPKSVGNMPLVAVSVSGSTEYVPSAATVVSYVTSGVPSPSVSISTVIVSPGSPVPAMVGVVSLTGVSSIDGASVSIETVAVSVLPAGSVTVISSVSSSSRVGNMPLVGESTSGSTNHVPSVATVVS